MDEQAVNDSTIFLCLAGSHSYGTNIAASDVDYRGICIPRNKSYYVGMGINKFDLKDKWTEKSDKVIYDLRKALSLMCDGNPNIIEMPFIPEKHWIKSTKAWLAVVTHREHFLSKKLRFTFGGYAFAQLKRIRSHRVWLLNPPKGKPYRSDFGLPENKVINSDNMGAFQWLVARLLRDSIHNMNLSDQTKEELSKVEYIGPVQSNNLDYNALDVVSKLTGAPDSYVDLVMREKRYASAISHWNSYQNWKLTRNPKRAEMEQKFGWDCKHGMHLVRLLRMGMEILETGQVIVDRPDKEELISIRNGAWSFDQAEEYAQQCEKKLASLYNTTSLPHNPNRIAIDKLCVQLLTETVFAKEFKDAFDKWLVVGQDSEAGGTDRALPS
jgi:predicted nucleotidyltransferase